MLYYKAFRTAEFKLTELFRMAKEMYRYLLYKVSY